MSPARRVIVYSLIRVILFVIPFGIVMFLAVDSGVPVLAAAVIAALAAAVVAACLSFLFLRPQRDAVATTVYGWRHGDHHDEDNDIENEAIDRSEHGKAGS